MPTYPVKNLKTGEQKEIQMSMTEYDQWRKDNPDWDKDLSLIHISEPRDRQKSRMPSSA